MKYPEQVLVTIRMNLDQKKESRTGRKQHGHRPLYSSQSIHFPND